MKKFATTVCLSIELILQKKKWITLSTMNMYEIEYYAEQMDILDSCESFNILLIK